MSLVKLILASLGLVVVLLWLIDRWLDRRERRRQAEWNLRHIPGRKSWWEEHPPNDEIEGDH